MDVNRIPIFLFSLYSSLLESSHCKQAWEINEGLRDGPIYGDMLLTPIQQQRYDLGNDTALTVRGVSVKESAFNRWDDNIVPFIISPQYSSQQVQVLKSSLRRFEQISCFKFKERTHEYDYLFIVPLDGCYSYVGKIGGRQTMSLAVDCIADYIIWHEMMHALGFEHEHQRPDRDSFIRVEYHNVQPGQLVNFNKLAASQVDFPDTYDYQSIMHYDSHAFGMIDTSRRIRLATMIPTKSGVELIDNLKFSATDIAKLNRLGKCSTNGGAGVETKQKTSGTCRDFAKNCDHMKQKGMCTMPFFRASMEKNCPSTCSLCPKKAHDNLTNALESVLTCQDAPSVNCSRFRPQCSVKQYEELMTRLCPETCGFCSRSSDAVCQDSDENCMTYVANGFCTNEFYSSVRHKLCLKSCNLC
ncbi:unnamed protein product [Caenorhabditis auriculariae]|uniref:Metalloendopeptidase n=1 Tax=Caenorhabditis auriculariae TaxID=2777116 RepID=A0A8S1HA08_9PELO|nr:unnamed protein product [Caenorhabditis auriculariae]